MDWARILAYVSGTVDQELLSTACRGYAGLGQFPIFLLIQFFDPTGSELMILEFPMCTGHARKNRIQPFNVIDDSRVTTLLSENGAPCSSLLA